MKEFDVWKENNNEEGVITTKSMNDKEGRIYHNFYSNLVTNANLAINNKNYTFSGEPKVVIREGKSVFGDELLFQFNIKAFKSKYDMRTKYPTFEVYFPMKEGAEFFISLGNKLKRYVETK